ncbi:MAG: lipopolysaccharide heptosyltransferase II [Magnetococcus sp. MYC-9]
MAHPLLRLLKQRQPQRAIDVVAPGWSQPLLQRMPEVRQTWCLEVGHGQLGLGRRWRLGRQLRGRYTQAIILPGSFKSALLPLHAGIHRRTGFLGEWRWGLLNDIRPLDKNALLRTVDRFLALGLAPGEALPTPMPMPTLAVERSQALVTLRQWRTVREDIGQEGGEPLLALCPGAEYGPAKRWPAERFAELAGATLARGWGVVVCGSAKEASLGEQIATTAGAGCLNLAGRTSLDEAVQILSLASCVISNDSGLMHVAAALERPLIALFGSSDPHHTPPLGSRSRVISLGLPCAPCFQRICPEQHLNCLRQITTARVLAEMEACAG